MSHELILVIDHQEYWREFSKQALESAGFNVCTYDPSIYLNTQCEHSHFKLGVSERKTFPDETALHDREEQGGNGAVPLQTPDLIIVGCAQIDKEERVLIEQLLAAQYHLLVVSTFLPGQVMRSLFLQGVDDVADKPYTSTSLIAIVQDTLQSIRARNLFGKPKVRASSIPTEQRRDEKIL